MKLRLLLAVLALAACTRSGAVAPPAASPAPAARPSASTPMAVVSRDVPPASPRYKEAPANWQLLDETADGIAGISVERAMRELLAGKQPRRTVVVAVIDAGVDTAHVDLKANLWTNTKEIPGNGVDDDNNGFVDDVHGWNFIGGKDGRDVQWDTMELTRLYVSCAALPATKLATPRPDDQQCKGVVTEFEKKRKEAEGTLDNIQGASDALTDAIDSLKKVLSDSVTVDRVTAFRPTTPPMQRARAIFLQLASQGITMDVVKEAKDAYSSQVKYGYSTTFDPRAIVGDNYANPTERQYGNPDVMGPGALHGTHVAGIIGAVRGNGVGVDGIAGPVRIMALRAVPDGDERDKDIANSIRYAADNGAQIISMSFGKGYSPFKQVVDDAVKYADAKGVLMVHGAGNDGADLDTAHSYPNRKYLAGGTAQNWMEVGAVSWKGGDSLVADFSNYGKQQVDVFAPGVDILSTVPGKEAYKRESGTSMAAPVVSGLAALIMEYYPTLTAAQVKQIIIQSVTPHRDQLVLRPNDDKGAKVPFGSLSVGGGIVNAYNALRMAEAMAKQP
jgi:subtilisin family serine protease